MKLYYGIQGWVDRQWSTAVVPARVLMLPAVIPLIVILMIGPTSVSTAIGWGWFGLWNLFIFWRFWFYLREISREGDRHYDRVGKYRLDKEYHDTESATSAAERKRRKR